MKTNNCIDCKFHKGECTLAHPDIRHSNPFLGKPQPDYCLDWRDNGVMQHLVNKVRKSFGRATK